MHGEAVFRGAPWVADSSTRGFLPFLIAPTMLHRPPFAADQDWVELVPFLSWLVRATEPRVILDVSGESGGPLLGLAHAAIDLRTCVVHAASPASLGDRPAWVDAYVRALPESLLGVVRVHDRPRRIDPGTVGILVVASADQARQPDLMELVADSCVVLLRAEYGSNIEDRSPGFSLPLGGGLVLSPARGRQIAPEVDRLLQLPEREADVVRSAFALLGMGMRQGGPGGTQARNRQLAQRVAELEAEVAALAQTVEEQHGASLANEALAQRYQRLAEDMQASRSWRVTRPFRTVEHRLAPSTQRSRDPSAEPSPASSSVDARSAEELRSSGLLDADWYRARHPEVTRSGLDPIAHQLGQFGPAGMGWGGLEGQDPNPWFDSLWFRQRYGDARAPGQAPVIEYLRSGPQEDRDPSFWFDAAWYRSSHHVNGGPPYGTPLEWFARSGWPAEQAFPGRLRHEPRRRVVFLTGQPDHPGHRYRILDACAALPPNVFETAVLACSEWPARSWVLTGADVLWIWRTPMSRTLEEILARARSEGARVIFDIDDLVFDDTLTAREVDGIRSQALDEQEQAGHARRIAESMASADLIVTPTSPLAWEATSRGWPAATLPNGYDRSFADAASGARARRAVMQDGLFRVGYAAGSKTHQRDLAQVEDALAAFLSEHEEARLVLFRGATDISELGPLASLGQQVEWRDPVPLEELPYEYARFDVNIAPVEVGNRFCEGKSALKLTEAALVGVPTIASPTQPFREAVESGVRGVLAERVADWTAALESLSSDPVLRVSIGEEARHAARWWYGPEVRALRIQELLDDFLSPGAMRRSPASRGMGYPAALPPALALAADWVQVEPGSITLVVPGTFEDAAACIEEVEDRQAAQLDIVSCAGQQPGAEHVWALRDRVARLATPGWTEEPTVSALASVAAHCTRTFWLVWVPSGARLHRHGVKRLLQVAEATGSALVCPGLMDPGMLRDVRVLESGDEREVALVSSSLLSRGGQSPFAGSPPGMHAWGGLQTWAHQRPEGSSRPQNV